MTSISRYAPQLGRGSRKKSPACSVNRSKEAKGYLERRPDAHDRRAKRIHLTERGQKNIAMAKRATADIEDHLAELLGQRRYHLLRRALEDVIAADATY